jgi:CheY-like chemotaxis protein
MNNSGPFRILLADDDPDDRELFTEAAQSQDAIVDSVPNGIELMDILNQAEQLPNFILLDLNMPEKGGKDCLREIRQYNRFDSIPVIIYSTSSSRKDIDDTFALGANLYISKPNSFSELKNTIRNILKMDWSDKRNAGRDSFVYLS